MASLSAIRDGLAARLATISGLRVSDTIPSQISPPAALIAPELIAYDSTMARGSDDYLFTVTLLVSKSHDKWGQDALDAYLAGSGASSVKAAIEADKTLGGVVHFARLSQARDYGMHLVGDIEYFGVELAIEVTASGS